MFHMLEHVADPRRVLATTRGWLREPGGVLVVEVPNVDSIAQAPAHRFHFAHFYSFSAATLAALGESVGLAALRCETTSDGGNVTCVFGRGESGPRPVQGLPDSVRRTGDLLRRHTTLRHYLRATPYVRVVERLARRWREDRLLRKLPTVDAVIAWAGTGGPGLRQ